MKILDHEGWEIHYDPEGQNWWAERGRARIKPDGHWNDKQSTIMTAITDRNASDARKKVRKNAEPLAFRLWDDKKEEERKVTLQSYSNQGLRFVGGENQGCGNTFLVIKDTLDSTPLHRAVEALRVAEAAMAAALKLCTVQIKAVHKYEWSAADYHKEEDRMRAEIAEAKKR